MSETKKCPYCDEEIKYSAKKCKHCGEWIDDNNSNLNKESIIINAFAQQYEVIEEIGRGGMAVVYKARQKSLDRIVALKIVPKEFTHDKEFVTRFKKEAKDGALLNHPNIVTIHDSGEIGGYLYMSMEYLEGKTLSQKLRDIGKPFTENQIKKILIPILDGLSHAHAKGIIHRDIKSSNIMFDVVDRPVLMDFGIAKSMEGTRMTKTGTYMGTPEYSSPEQAKSENVDLRTDIYSIGIVAYEMGTGAVPFKGNNPLNVLNEVIRTAPKSFIYLSPNSGVRFSNAIMKAITKDPDKRYQDCDSFTYALKNGEDETNLQIEPEPIIPTSKTQKIETNILENPTSKFPDENYANKKIAFLKKSQILLISVVILLIILLSYFLVNSIWINDKSNSNNILTNKLNDSIDFYKSNLKSLQDNNINLKYKVNNLDSILNTKKKNYSIKTNPVVTITPLKLKILYVGVKNPISVKVYGIPENKVKLSISYGEVKKVVNGEWEVIVHSNQNKTHISASAIIDGKTIKLGTSEFLIKRVPNPTAEIAGSTGGQINKNILLGSGAIITNMNDFEFNLNFEITSYTFSTIINGDWIPKNVRGNIFSNEIKSIIRNGKRKQKFFFENIQGRGPDGTTRSLNSINLELK